MEKAVARIISYAVRLTDPERIILFGSRARGTHNLHSDVDLLIISTLDCRQTELELQIGAYAKESCLKADILIHTPADIESAARSPWSFLTSILREGKVVYERP